MGYLFGCGGPADGCQRGYGGPARAHAETVIDEWAGVNLPSVPALKPVTLAPAILAMDFTTQTCTPQRRLRCANLVPQVAKLRVDMIGF